MEENRVAWELWNILSAHDRPTGFGLARIPTMAIERLCETYGQGFDTYQKILLIESKMYPALVEKAKRDKK